MMSSLWHRRLSGFWTIACAFSLEEIQMSEGFRVESMRTTFVDRTDRPDKVAGW
jgi:hypothetical protein